MKKAVDDIENQYCEYLYDCMGHGLCGVVLDEDNYKRFKLLDQLESFLFQCLTDPYRMQEERPLYEGILKQATELGIYWKVNALMIHALTKNNTYL